MNEMTILEPSEADLLSFPPTLRLIYQLLRCLMGVNGCAGVIYTSVESLTEGDNMATKFPSTNSATNRHPSQLPSDGVDFFPKTRGDIVEPDVFAGFQGHPPRDPVVLRHILECLNFLIRVGNVLQNILTAATRAATRAAAASDQPSTNPSTAQATLTGPPAARTQRGQASAGVAASVAPLNVQASFVFYLVEHCLIPAYAAS